jgi:asparagine synthase (glutamine-hydrolysing)
VLLAHRAIFGVAAFRDPEQAALRLAGIERRARALGARTTSWSVGPVVLGVAEVGAPDAPCEEARASCRRAVVAGEIFNGPELLLELTGRRETGLDAGAVFERVYSAWGARCFARLDGAYAGALWDESSRHLVLACDRRADTHLFYHHDSGAVSFSSWLRLLGGLAKGVERTAVTEFLRFLYIAAPRTIYDGIAKLEPGTHLVASEHGVRVTRHPEVSPSWSRVDLGRWPAEDVLRTFEALLNRSIERRFQGRRTAVFMSSGVDSGTIAAAARRLSPGRIAAVTVAFEDPNLDESGWARAFTTQLGIEHRVFPFGLRDYRTAFETMSRTFDQPFADPAGLPLVLACQATAADFELYSGGTGGDDLFGTPIPKHLRFSLEVAARMPGLLRRQVARALAGGPGLGRRYASLFEFEDPEELLITWPGWRRAELERLLGEPVRLDETTFYEVFHRCRPLGVQVLYDQLGVFPPDDCRFEAAAVGGHLMHFPYHDQELVSYVRALPAAYRTDGVASKLLLHRLFHRYAPGVAGRAKKRYFTMPLEALMSYQDHSLVRDYLGQDVVSRLGVVHPAATQATVERYVRGDGSLMFKTWALAVLHAWLAHLRE